MTSAGAEDESLDGLTGGPSESDSEESKQENDSNLGKRYFITALTNKVITTYIFKTFTDTKEIYWYDNKSGIYRSNGESIIETLVESTKPNISTHEVNEIINHVRRRTLTPRSEFDSQIEWLTLENCVVNLTTLETRSHSPEFMVTTMIPVSYFNEDGALL
jgi:phage/plasmid-associated DNA primase